MRLEQDWLDPAPSVNVSNMVLHNPNNWHWVTKDASPWAKEYLENEIQKVSAEEDGITAKITKLVSLDGDVEVSQRKGKVITIYDVSLQLEYEGSSLCHLGSCSS